MKMPKIIDKFRCFEGEQIKYTHYSEILKCDMTFSVYLPENKSNEQIELIWWLSGLTCNDDNFSQKSGFQRLASKYNVAVIIPDTSPRGENIPDSDDWDMGQGAGFYLDATREPWNKNYKMYSYITKELTDISRVIIPNFSGKESIMGHSMGGYGALVLALKNSKRFACASAFAPILNASKVPWGIKAFSNYLGDDASLWDEWDLNKLIGEVKAPPIFITQGTSDKFYEIQLKEEAFLNNAKIKGNKIIYKKVLNYDHSYFFISSFIEEHFMFHIECLRKI